MQNLTTQISSSYAEVFSTEKGAIYQCDRENCWFIDFAGKIARFDYRNILKLKQAIYKIDIEDILLNGVQEPDVEIIFICACDDCYVLSLVQVIELKQLLQGTFVMLELNHIIQDTLYRTCL
ncbi:hypothetical protein LPB86_08455 [Pedobacter sp. MC2016-14]|uniref:hypothetical protein n=1 Tax=Pedobacter sp. MC2016-14 TaxID=2897327 RepID=UPI001E5FA527|nr:hypothetical protein [Pedobacter sp. MC2016-14]MCD0488257.1 hypothetical protein [Pedobacter sp. MC2016-14]